MSHVRGLCRHLPVEVHPHAVDRGHRRCGQHRVPRARPRRPRDLRGRRGRVPPPPALWPALSHGGGPHGQGGWRRPRRRHPPEGQRPPLPLRDALLMARRIGAGRGQLLQERLRRFQELPQRIQGSQVWTSIFRPGSIFRKGYTDSPRNRSYVIMNSVLYHLHPVKVKRHAVKVSYTLCLGGLSFFLFILLTVTGIFLMFFYRPTAAQAWNDISTLQTSVTFGLLVRNMHRWGAHLMVLSVFLHMARVFYHGAYKSPREFNWVIGVILLTLTLLLSFTGYLLPWDQLALWAVTVGTNMIGDTPVFGNQVRFVLLGTKEIGTETLLRWYVLHVLLFPFVTVIFMAIHFWRVRKDGGVSGPL